MKKIKILLAAIVVSSAVMAQDSSATKKGLSVGLNTYLAAPGLVIGKTLKKDKLHARVGFNALAFDIPSSMLENVSPADTIQVGGNFRINRGFLALDYQVKGILNLTAGVQYNDFGGQIAFAMTNDYVVDTVATIGVAPNQLQVKTTATITKEQIGNIRVDIETSKFAPFVGLALGRTVPNKKIGFRFETGLVFQGAMKVTLQDKTIDTGLDDASGNDIVYNIGDPTNMDPTNQEIIKAVKDVNDELSGLTFLPYVSFSLNYKIQ